MRTKDFVHDFIVKKAGTSAIARIKFSPHSDANHMKTIHWDYYQRLADLTNLLTFGCDFNELGCQSRRWPSLERLQQMEKDDRRRFRKAQMCCCSDCRISFGHLYVIPDSPGIIKMYARNFNEETGFWRMGKGCVLKRKYRSPVCLSARCGIPVKPEKSGEFLLKLIHKDQKFILDEYRRWTNNKSFNTMNQVINDLRRRILKEIRDENRVNSKQA